MNLLADESVDRQIVDQLSLDGHRVLYVAEMAPGISDDAVLDLANQEGVVLLTADKDFGELLFRQRRATRGVVLVRLAGLSPERKAGLVSSAIRQRTSQLTGAFTVITPGMVRVRRSTGF